MSTARLLLSGAACVLCTASAVLTQHQDEPQAPSREEIEAAVTEVEQAFKSKDPAERAAVVPRAAAIVDSKVIKALEKGLRDKDDSVRLAVMEAFGRLPHEDALHELQRFYKSDNSKLKKDAHVLGTLLKEIGRHGDPKSIEVLAHDVWENIDNEVVKARIYGLGNIRDKDSVEALFKLMNMGRPNPGEDSAFMPHFRVALARLTGTDQTTNKTLWQDWWREHGKKFEVAQAPPTLPADIQGDWDGYWGTAAEADEAAPSEEGRGQG